MNTHHSDSQSKPDLRIAFVDNMNNNFFSFANYIYDIMAEGWDVNVEANVYEVSTTPAHFAAQADTWTPVEHLPWVRKFSLFKIREIAAHDLVIACGWSVGVLAAFGIRVDLIRPDGAELYEVPYGRGGGGLEKLIRMALAPLQRYGIRRSRHVVRDPAYAPLDVAANRLGIRWESATTPNVYRMSLKDTETWNFLRDYDFVVFHHGRHLWKTCDGELPGGPELGGNMRNDKVIRAFARFVEESAYTNPVLVMFEYGPDVEATRELVSSLGIASRVKWMPIMQRKEVMAGLSRSHVCCAEFREGLCGFGSTCMEAMCLGIPLLTHTRGMLEASDHYLYKAPIIDALSEEDILKVLKDYERDPAPMKEIGEAGRAWYDKYLGIDLTRHYLNRFKEMAECKAAGNS